MEREEALLTCGVPLGFSKPLYLDNFSIQLNKFYIGFSPRHGASQQASLLTMQIISI